jgi:hypothetical protein
MITKSIRKHTLREVKSITYEYTTLKHVRTVIRTMRDNYQWEVTGGDLQDMGFDVDTGEKRYWCRIDYIK